MAFYFALFNVSGINLEEHGKRQHYRELRKSRRDSGERTSRNRCRSDEGRQKTTQRRSIPNIPPKSNPVFQTNDNASISSAALARQETLSLITTNWSLDSIPLAMNDYHDLPKPQPAPTPTKARKMKGRKMSATRDMVTSTIRTFATPPMANGDVRRDSIRRTDNPGNDLFKILATPPKAVPAKSDQDRQKQPSTLTRRGSTPSYKRVTFQHEQHVLCKEDENELAHRRGSKGKSASKTGSGFFSKPVDFLGRLSWDDHPRLYGQRPHDHNVVQDRPLQTNEIASSSNQTSSSNNGENSNKNRPSSALSKLRAVIKKLIIENRRQRLLASRWPRGNSAETTTKIKGKCTKTPSTVTNSHHDHDSAAIGNENQENAPLLVTPTPTEPPLTPLTEQIQINFQNLANSFIEMQQKELKKQPQNLYAPFSSMLTRPQPNTTLTGGREQCIPETPTQVRATTDSEQILQPLHQGGRENTNESRQIFVRLQQPENAIQNHEDTARLASSQATTRNVSQQQSSSSLLHSLHHPDLTHWNKLPENKITHSWYKAGSYHPHLVEQQIANIVLSQSASPNANSPKNCQHRPAEAQFSKAGSSHQQQRQISQNPPVLSLTKESHQVLEGANSTLATPPRREKRGQKAPTNRQHRVNEKTEQSPKHYANVIRRRSTTDKKSNPEKFRSIFGNTWQRWVHGRNGPTTQTRNANIKQTSKAPIRSDSQNGSDDDAADFQSLLSQVQYDENRNLNLQPADESGNRHGHYRPDHKRHQRKKHASSLIIGGNDEIEYALMPTTKEINDTTKRRRRRLPLNCYINPLFTSHSAPNSPAKIQQSSSSLQRQQKKQNLPNRAK